MRKAEDATVLYTMLIILIVRCLLPDVQSEIIIDKNWLFDVYITRRERDLRGHTAIRQGHGHSYKVRQMRRQCLVFQRNPRFQHHEGLLQCRQLLFQPQRLRRFDDGGLGGLFEPPLNVFGGRIRWGGWGGGRGSGAGSKTVRVGGLGAGGREKEVIN